MIMFIVTFAGIILLLTEMDAHRHLLEDSGLVFMQKLIKEELDIEVALSDAWLQGNNMDS